MMNTKIETLCPEFPLPVKSPWFHMGIDFLGQISFGNCLLLCMVCTAYEHCIWALPTSLYKVSLPCINSQHWICIVKSYYLIAKNNAMINWPNHLEDNPTHKMSAPNIWSYFFYNRIFCSAFFHYKSTSSNHNWPGVWFPKQFEYVLTSWKHFELIIALTKSNKSIIDHHVYFFTSLRFIYLYQLFAANNWNNIAVQNSY